MSLLPHSDGRFSTLTRSYTLHHFVFHTRAVCTCSRCPCNFGEVIDGIAETMAFARTSKFRTKEAISSARAHIDR
jgi:hypothetical protein